MAVQAGRVNWTDGSMTTGIPDIMRLGYGLRCPREPIRGTDRRKKRRERPVRAASGNVPNDAVSKSVSARHTRPTHPVSPGRSRAAVMDVGLSQSASFTSDTPRSVASRR